MGAAQAGDHRIIGQLVDGLFGLFPAFVIARMAMAGPDLFGPCREVHFRHGQVGALGAFQQIGVNRIVDDRLAIIAQFHIAARVIGVETVSQQGDGGGQVRQPLDFVAGIATVTAHQGTGEARVHGHHFQLVPCRAVHPVLEHELVGIQGLGCAVVRCHFLVINAEGEGGRMQEGALAHPALGVRCVGTHQQGRGLDTAAGRNHGFRLDGNGGAGGHLVVVERTHFHPGDGIAIDKQAVGLSAVDQGGAIIHGGRQGGHQHGLLGVGGTTHTAIADVPAAFHIARDHRPFPAQRVAAFFQHVVVGVGGHDPLADLEPFLHLLEPGVEIIAQQVFHSEGVLPVLQGFVGGAEGAGPVDHGGAAHGAALQNGHAGILGGAHGAFLIQVPVGLAFVQGEVVRTHQLAGFDENHLEAALGENFRADAAAGTGADDYHIRFQGAVSGNGTPVDYIPAVLDAGFPRVVNALDGQGRQILHGVVLLFSGWCRKSVAVQATIFCGGPG